MLQYAGDMVQSKEDRAMEDEAEAIEYSLCEDRLYDLRRLARVIEEDMPEDEEERNKQSAFGRVYDLLFKCELILMGRKNELDPDYCARWERWYRFPRTYRKEAELAREHGVNFVALWENVPSSDGKVEAIEYITENGLSSLNYEATCKAIEEYERDRLERWEERVLS